MKSAKETLRDRVVIKDGFFEGAHITLPESEIAKLMKKYAKKYHKDKLKRERN
jgi:hypothetical protein